MLGSPLCYFVWKFYSNNFSPAYTAVLNTWTYPVCPEAAQKASVSRVGLKFFCPAVVRRVRMHFSPSVSCPSRVNSGFRSTVFIPFLVRFWVRISGWSQKTENSCQNLFGSWGYTVSR